MPEFKPDDDRAETLLRLFANDLIKWLNPSRRALTDYAGTEPFTWDESVWVYEEVGRLILRQLDED